VKNQQARLFQLKMGMDFLASATAAQELELGLTAGVNPAVTIFFKEKTRIMFPAQAPWSHLLEESITLGAGGMKLGATSVKEITAMIVAEIQAVTKASEVAPHASLINLGLDSFGFVELGGRIQKNFGIDVQELGLTPEKTVKELAVSIHKLIQVRYRPAVSAFGSQGLGLDPWSGSMLCSARPQAATAVIAQ
jgi:acyl carrier protein